MERRNDGWETRETPGTRRGGARAGGYALYNVTLDTIFVSVFAVVATVIFWRRSNDLVALLVATMLLVWGPLNGLLGSLRNSHPALRFAPYILPKR